MPMSSKERKQRFKAAAALRAADAKREMTLEEAARELLGVSYWHLSEVMAGNRDGSDELKRDFATLIDIPVADVWGKPKQKSAVA